ncbi:MAG: hypothetical protein H6Q59_1967 [Firmicutes bacterium]|nr:hypothetical protein [Bacillota bacterium]
MKKIVLSMIMILLLVSFVGCKKNSDNTKQNTEDRSPTAQPTITLPPETTGDEIGEAVGEKEVFTLEDYFPFEADTEYVYEGAGNEYASYRRFIDYIDVPNEKLQTRTENGGTVTVRVLQIKDGALSVVYLANESYIRDNFMNQTSGEDAEVLLMEPLTKGTNWTLSDGSTRSITGEKVPVTTPYGSFEALEVTTESTDSTIKDYYAVGVGLVKTVFESEGMEVSSTLSTVNKNTSYKQFFTLYYPDADEKIYMVPSELALPTGSDVLTVLEEAMKKEPPKDTYLPLMSKNTKLNSLTLEEGNILHVDFSRAFVDEMNAGAGYELRILQSVANTLGNYFGISKVRITLDGKPYESGHILMNEGEVFEVSMEDVVQ